MKTIRSIGNSMISYMRRSQRYREGDVPGINTGYDDIDFRIKGLQPGELICIAGRPSTGKTALGANIAFNAVSSGKVVLIYSPDMSAETYLMRMCSIMTGIPFTSLLHGKMEGGDWNKVEDVINELESKGLAIDDTKVLTIGAIFEGAKKVKDHMGLDLVVIDCIEDTFRVEKSEDDDSVRGVMERLKSMAEELGVPVIYQSQLSRTLEDRDDHRPRITDLPYPSIAAVSDVIWLIYRDGYYDPESETPDIFEIYLAKRRCGPPGTVHLRWYGESGKLEEEVLKIEADCT